MVSKFKGEYMKSYLYKKKLFTENPTCEDALNFKSIEVMREAIKNHAIYSPLISSVFKRATHLGLNENDAMIMLAFHAVSKCEHLEEMLLDTIHNQEIKSAITL
jgi:hypothetical protein